MRKTIQHSSRSHRPSIARPPCAASRRARGLKGTGFAAERQPRAIGPEPARIHIDDCLNAGPTHPITAQDARAALLDPMVQACEFCRPDTELGTDVD
ncbi:hypothetical protein GCM10010121_071650 [Streptomyces brasiliensis]|uniref:Uncharacterized protein n=1 Tax=Streptomyces brasiliensis TaxID=1954 RepID=A0A917L9T1_9ACTN|nr:hypothetical protein GCM10010121_071650 [Streptomyces brasiliensis]